MDKKVFIGTVVVVAVVAGLGGYLSAGRISVPGVAGGCDKLQAKLDEVKKILPVPPDTNFVSGQVEAVNGNVITLKTQNVNPFDESPRVRQVTVTDATKIIKNESKQPDVFQKEQEAYQKKMSAWKPGSADTLPVPPVSYTEKEISLSDIKPGDQLNVEAANKVGMVANFEAMKVTQLYSAPAGVRAPAASPASVPPSAPAAAPVAP